MRVSEYYDLGRTQPELDFIDVDVEKDLRVYIDPRAFQLLHSDWGEECVALIQGFFSTVLEAITNGDHAYAQRLLAVLGEPNETHLGQSRGRSRGRGMGRGLARDVWEALSHSEAVQTGLLQDLEDTALMVPGIDVDIVSDITTNIVRRPLIQFTQDACTYYGIPLVQDIASGPTWNPVTRTWQSRYVRLPVAAGRKLLLVPKSVVRGRLNYNFPEYYNNYVLGYLREIELSAMSSLVEILKSGERRVTKKRLKQKYGTTKEDALRVTLQHPEILEQYRAAKRRTITSALHHDDIAALDGTEAPDWDRLLKAVLAVPRGPAGADSYHRAVEALLTALLYPALGNARREFKLHEGRKRIDIMYTNFATSGFFHWLIEQHRTPAAYVPVECKNYTRPVGNPEFDQLAGRFSPVRGKVGLLVYRSYEDKGRLVASCRDTARDDRGYILALDDGDLERLVAERKRRPQSTAFRHLHAAFEALL